MGEKKPPYLPLLLFGIALLCLGVGYSIGMVLLGSGLTIHEEVFQTWMLISMLVLPLCLTFSGMIGCVLDIFRGGIHIKKITAFILNASVFVGLMFFVK